MSLRDLFAVKPVPVLHVATPRQCNMQQMRPESATAHATRTQRYAGNPCVPTIFGATPHATLTQHEADCDVACAQFSASGSQAAATSGSDDDAPDTAPAQDLPLLTALAEFDALIDRLCELSKHPPEVREEMRRVRYGMAPCDVPRQMAQVRELVRRAECRKNNP